MSGDQALAPVSLTIWDRGVLAAVMIVPGIVGSIPSLSNLLVLPFINEFHASRASVIFLIEVGMVLSLLVSPVVGRALLRTTPWIIMVVGAVLAGAGLFGMSVAPSYALAMTGLIVAHGLGIALSGVLPSQTFVVRHYPERQGIVSGVQTVSTAIGGIVISLTMPAIIANQGWRTAGAICAVVVLVVPIALVVTLLREPQTRTPDRRPGLGSRTPAGAQADDGLIGVAPTTAEILRMKSFWLLVIAVVPLAVAALAVSINVLPFFAERGVDTQQASYVLAGIGAASAFGALATGAIVDRVHPAKVIAAIAALAFVSLASIAVGFGNPAIYFIVMYVGLAGVAPVLSVGVTRLFGRIAYAPIFGLVGPFLLISAFSGAGTGWLRDHVGSYQPVFAILAALIAGSLGAALLLTRHRLVTR